MTAALEGGEWSAARPGLTLPRKRHGTNFTGGWLGPRASLDWRKISSPTGFDPLTFQPVVNRYTDWATGPATEINTKEFFGGGWGVGKSRAGVWSWHLCSDAESCRMSKREWKPNIPSPFWIFMICYGETFIFTCHYSLQFPHNAQIPTKMWTSKFYVRKFIASLTTRSPCSSTRYSHPLAWVAGLHRRIYTVICT